MNIMNNLSRNASRYIRLFAASLLILSFLLPFSSCNTQSGDADPEKSDSQVESTTDSEITVSLDGYTVIRPEKASTAVLNSAKALFSKLKELNFNTDIGDDWIRSVEDIPSSAKEILIGQTNREESSSAFKELAHNDYVIKYFESGRIVICGGSDGATQSAVEHFISTHLDTKKDLLSSEIYFKHTDKYEVENCTVNKNAISSYTLVIPKKATADEKYAAELIKNEIADRTGFNLTVIKDSEMPQSAGNLIIIGSTSMSPLSLLTSDTSYVLGADGNNVIVCGNNGMTVYSARKFISSLFVKNSSTASLTLENSVEKKKDEHTLPSLDELGKYPVALADQKNACIAVYDLSPVKSGGEPSLKWEFTPTKANGFNADKTYGNRVDEARLRYSEKHSSYVVGFTSSSGYVGLASYPEGKCLWEVKLSSTSPHTIEYLPNGLVAVACSGGSDTSKGFVRLYNIESSTYAEAKLVSAHGLLWDDDREILWALGGKEIVAYDIGNNVKSPALSPVSFYGTSSVKGGHDMSAIPDKPNTLWISGSSVWQFNMSTGELSSSYDGNEIISEGSVKCICSFPDGSVIRTKATGVYADHNTDTLSLYFFVDGNAKKDVVFEGRAFYKSRVFLPAY